MKNTDFTAEIIVSKNIKKKTMISLTAFSYRMKKNIDYAELTSA